MKVVCSQNGDLLAGLAIPRPVVLQDCHNIHAVFHLAEDHMLAIQPLSLGSADEKLGTICVASSICPGQDAKTCVLQDGILIMKFLPVMDMPPMPLWSVSHQPGM